MATRMTPSTDLPTEPGFYLFFGERNASKIGHRDLMRVPRAELVRVSMGRPEGDLRYIGTDFFWTPEEAVGLWVRLDIQDWPEQALRALRVRFLTGVLAEFPRGSNTREGLSRFLLYEVFGAWDKDKLAPESQAFLEELVSLAVDAELVSLDE